MQLTGPLVIGAFVAQQAIYDVPGGNRAVLFDRFSGVRDKVRLRLLRFLTCY